MNGVSFRHGQVKKTSSKGVKHLDIWLENNLSFEEHFKKEKERAERSLATILRLISIVEGTKMCGVVLYQAPL